MKAKLLCIASLVLTISIFQGCVETQKLPYDLEGKTHSAITPAHNHNWWTTRHLQVLQQIKNQKVDLIFVGDSITHRWDGAGKKYWDKYYAPRNAVNMGFGGDRTEHVLWRLNHGEIDNINPKLAVLMIGTNNRDSNSAQEVADGIKAICAKMRNKLPNTKILLLGIFPVHEKPDPFRDKQATTSLIASKIADNDMIYYMNINDKFLTDDGTLPHELMPDELHPSEQGYKIWAQAIEPKITELMGEK